MPDVVALARRGARNNSRKAPWFLFLSAIDDATQTQWCDENCKEWFSMVISETNKRIICIRDLAEAIIFRAYHRNTTYLGYEPPGETRQVA